MVKVKVKDLPEGRSPESNILSVAVQVWVALSWLVTVTVVPDLTVRAAGVNAKFLMLSVLPAAADGTVLPVGAPAVTAGSGPALVLLDVLGPEQPLRAAVTSRTPITLAGVGIMHAPKEYGLSLVLVEEAERTGDADGTPAAPRRFIGSCR